MGLLNGLSWLGERLAHFLTHCSGWLTVQLINSADFLQHVQSKEAYWFWLVSDTITAAFEFSLSLSKPLQLCASVAGNWLATHRGFKSLWTHYIMSAKMQKSSHDRRLLIGRPTSQWQLSLEIKIKNKNWFLWWARRWLRTCSGPIWTRFEVIWSKPRAPLALQSCCRNKKNPIYQEIGTRVEVQGWKCY